MRMRVDPSRTSYEPNSLDMTAPRGRRRRIPNVRCAGHTEGTKLRIRPESFADHYTQAHLFYKSMTEPEQRHIAAAFTFQLGKCREVKRHPHSLLHSDFRPVDGDQRMGFEPPRYLGREGIAVHGERATGRGAW